MYSEKRGWRGNRYEYPEIDFTRYREMDFLNYPEVIVLSSFSFEQIETALKSEKLSRDYIWDQRYNRDWWDSLPPSPRVFRFL